MLFVVAKVESDQSGNDHYTPLLVVHNLQDAITRCREIIQNNPNSYPSLDIIECPYPPLNIKYWDGKILCS